MCEAQGSDETGTGSESAPFKTALRVLEQLADAFDDSCSIVVRKAAGEGGESDGGFQDISGAGLKKAKKAYEANVKKAQKAAERAVADAAKSEKEAAEEAKRIEYAKNIVLIQDAKLPVAEKVGAEREGGREGGRWGAIWTRCLQSHGFPLTNFYIT